MGWIEHNLDGIKNRRSRSDEYLNNTHRNDHIEMVRKEEIAADSEMYNDKNLNKLTGASHAWKEFMAYILDCTNAWYLTPDNNGSQRSTVHGTNICMCVRYFWVRRVIEVLMSITVRWTNR